MDNYNTQWHVAAIYGWGEDMVGMRIKLSGYVQIKAQMNILVFEYSFGLKQIV